MDQPGVDHKNTFAEYETAIDSLKWLTAPSPHAVSYVEVMPIVFELRRKQTALGRAP